MTVEDAKEITEIVKEKLKENGDVYSEHILAYVSYLETQVEKLKCCGNCINRGLEKYIAYPCSECRRWHRELDSDKWEMEE